MIFQQEPNGTPLVRELQSLLKDLGFYSGSIDDIFGAKTEAAIIAFQKAQGLNPDGIRSALKTGNSLSIKVVVRLIQVQSQLITHTERSQRSHPGISMTSLSESLDKKPVFV